MKDEAESPPCKSERASRLSLFGSLSLGPDSKRKGLQFGIFRGILDLLGEGEQIAASTGANSVHAVQAGEVEALCCYEIHGCSHLEVFVEVRKVFQHVGALRQNRVVSLGLFAQT